MPMNTSVKFFSSTMLNAPKLSATKGSMIAVLDACLVDGWNLTTVDSMTMSNNGLCCRNRTVRSVCEAR